MSGEQDNWKSQRVRVHVCTGYKYIEPKYKDASILVKGLETFYSTVNDTLTIGDLCATLHSKIGTTLDRLGITIPDDMFEIYIYMTSRHIHDIHIFNLAARPIWTQVGINQHREWAMSSPGSILRHRIPVTNPYLRVVLMSPEIATIYGKIPVIIVTGPEKTSGSQLLLGAPAKQGDEKAGSMTASAQVESVDRYQPV